MEHRGDRVHMRFIVPSRGLFGYRGEFLTGFSLPDAPDFDTWAAIQGAAYQRQLETVYDHLTHHQLATHDSTPAVETAARWVARAPYNEVAYRRLMAAQALAGNRPAALKSFEKLREMLKSEFGIETARESVILAEQIRDRLRNTGVKAGTLNRP